MYILKKTVLNIYVILNLVGIILKSTIFVSIYMLPCQRSLIGNADDQNRWHILLNLTRCQNYTLVYYLKNEVEINIDFFKSESNRVFFLKS